MSISSIIIAITFIITIVGFVALSTLRWFKFRRTLQYSLMILLALFEIAAIFIGVNLTNTFIPAGYAGYIRTKPFFSPAKFEEIKFGASSTGVRWRTDAEIVAITPYTTNEAISAIQAKDNLLVDTEASITYSVKADSESVKKFFENYGGLNERVSDPDELVKDCYNHFIRPQFNMFIRDAVAKYNALEIKSHFIDIKTEVMANLNEYFANSPFVITAVAIQSTTPPAAVTEQITLKVAETQKLEQKQAAIQTAKAEEEIALAIGRAEANKTEQIALGKLAQAKAEADGKAYQLKAEADAKRYAAEQEAAGKKALAESIKLTNEAIGDNYIRLEAVKAVPNLKLPHILVGQDVFNWIQQAFSDQQ